MEVPCAVLRQKERLKVGGVVNRRAPVVYSPDFIFMKKILFAISITIALSNFCSADVGQIGHFISSTCPVGWLSADGSEFSSNIYPDLKIAVPNLCDSFPPFRCYLPQLGGYFIRSYTTNQVNDSSRLRSSFQNDSFQGHYHHAKPYTAAAAGGTAWGADGATQNGNNANLVKEVITDATYGTARVSTETRPINFSALVCIQAVSNNGGSVMISSVTIVGISSGTISSLGGVPLDVNFQYFIFAVIWIAAFMWGIKVGAST